MARCELQFLLSFLFTDLGRHVREKIGDGGGARKVREQAYGVQSPACSHALAGRPFSSSGCLGEPYSLTRGGAQTLLSLYPCADLISG